MLQHQTHRPVPELARILPLLSPCYDPILSKGETSKRVEETREDARITVKRTPSFTTRRDATLH
jgi:hypothetical protein